MLFQPLWLTIKTEVSGQFAVCDFRASQTKIRAVLPHIIPFRLGRRAEPFNDPAWLYELKWDGFRSLALIEDGRCELWSRNGNSFKAGRDLAGAVAQLGVNSAILDGEVVCLENQASRQHLPGIRS